MLIFQIPPILGRTVVRTHEPKRRISIVSNQLGPGKRSQGREMAGQSLLHFGLQRAVFGVAPWVTTDDHTTTTISAVAELWVLLECKPRRYRRLTVECAGKVSVRVGRLAAARIVRNAQRRTVLCDRTQAERIQVNIAERHKEATAAYVSGADNHLMRQLIFQAEVVIVSSRRALRR